MLCVRAFCAVTLLREQFAAYRIGDEMKANKKIQINNNNLINLWAQWHNVHLKNIKRNDKEEKN